MMSMFFALPADLAVVILRDWVDSLQELTALDVAAAAAAAASSARPKYLQLLCHPAFVVHVDLMHHIGDMYAHIRWLNRRHIRVQRVSVDVEQLPLCSTINLTSLQSIEVIELHGLGDKITIADLQCLLQQCSKVREVGFSHCPLIPVPALEAIMAIPSLAYSSLDLSLCDHLPVHVLSSLLSRFAPSLRRVRLGQKQSQQEVFHTISARCEALRRLSISSNDLDQAVLLRVLLTLPHLEYLSLSCGQISNSTALDIVRSLPNLTVVKFKDSCRVTSSALADILRIAHGLQFLEVTAVCQYRYHPQHHTGQRMVSTSSFSSAAGTPIAYHHGQPSSASCELLFTKSVTDPAVLLDSIRAAPHPVTSLCCASPLKTATLVHIADLAGVSLHTLKVALHHDVNDDSIAWIACEANHLHTLEMSRCHGLTDESLRVIAKYCKRLHSFGMRDGDHITDAGVAFLLGKLGGQLTELYLTGCPFITDTTVRALAVHCDSLHTLSLLGTCVTAEGIAEHLVAANRLPAIRHFTVSEAVKLALHHQLVVCRSPRWIKSITSFIF